MKPGRLPFASPLALISAVVAIAGIALAWWLTDGGLVSPGGLNRESDGEHHGGVARHADLDCEACHPGVGGGAMSDRCLACHDDTRGEIRAKAPLHGRLPDATACLHCHTEHVGAGAEITRVERDFPHEATGFALGGHGKRSDGARFRCGDCHGDDTLHFALAQCSTCHGKDPHDFLKGHVGDYGEACLGCHDGVDRFGKRPFDHGKTRFPLDGKHVDAACAKCHRGARALANFRDAPRTCVGCHKDDDVHKGDNGDDCGACHSTAAWKPAHRRGAGGAPAPAPVPDQTAPDAAAPDEPEAPAPDEPAPDDIDASAPAPRPPAPKPPAPKPPAPKPPEQEAPADHVFPLDHGGGGRVACATCHPRTTRAYTCFLCHEHTPANIESIHARRNIDDTSDCAGCHPTGGRARRR
jgi:hypothetical protein